MNENIFNIKKISFASLFANSSTISVIIEFEKTTADGNGMQVDVSTYFKREDFLEIVAFVESRIKRQL